MGNLIKSPQEIVVNPTIQMLIYGQAGVGKTTLALSAPAPLLIDTDGGVSRVNPGHRCDTVQVTDYQEVLDVLNEDLSKYQTIIIDTGGKLLDLMGVYLVRRNSKLAKRNGALTMDGFGERKAEFKRFCRLIRTLGKHIIFVAHRETKKDHDDNVRYVPIFGGSSYDDLVTDLDLVGYVEAYGRQRVITFDPTDKNDGKNTVNMPATVELPAVVDKAGIAAANDFVTVHVIEAFRHRLEEQAKLNELFAEAMEVVKASIECVTDADTANEVAAKLKKMEHVGNSKIYASRLLRDKCRDLGLTFNKEGGCYE